MHCKSEIKCTNLKTVNKSGGWWIHSSANHDIDCFKFKTLSGKDKFEKVKSNGICFRCSRGYHTACHCKVGRVCDVEIEGQGLYNQNHHPLLHPEWTEALLHYAKFEKYFTTLLNINILYSRNEPFTVLWVSGSDIAEG